MSKEQKERQRLLKNLNSQRNRLIKSGAYLSEIDALFGVKSNDSFSIFTTKELKNIYNDISSYGSKRVEKGKIILSKFEKNVKLIAKINEKDVYYPGNIKSQINSKAMRFNSDKEIKNYYKSLRYDSKKRYINKIKEIEGEGGKVARRLERMSLKDFEKMLDLSNGLASFNRVFETSPKDKFGKLSDEVLAQAREEELNVLNDVDYWSRKINRERRRRK